MKVNLVSVSQPRIDGMEEAEELLAYIARVSNPANQMKNETAPRLIRYLIKNQHWSPLEMVHVVIEIETTRDIARQILRHRSFSFQEFSQRYADPTSALGFTGREPRLQDLKNRQNSIQLTDEGDWALRDGWERRIAKVVDTAREAYDWAISQGIAKEQARVFLPEGLTVSRLYMAGSLRSWYHYCTLRTLAHGTQREHAEVAQACWDLIAAEFPATAEALQEITGVLFDPEEARFREANNESGIIHEIGSAVRQFVREFRHDSGAEKKGP
jgi:thymidylate synthase (FAD)